MDILTPDQRQDLRIVLERECERLRESVRWLTTGERTLGESQGEESDAGGEQADVASDLTEQTLDLSLQRSELERLEEVEAAIQRIDQATFGTCARCGASIGAARLMIMPWTRYCIRCSGRTGAGKGSTDA